MAQWSGYPTTSKWYELPFNEPESSSSFVIDFGSSDTYAHLYTHSNIHANADLHTYSHTRAHRDIYTYADSHTHTHCYAYPNSYLYPHAYVHCHSCAKLREDQLRAAEIWKYLHATGLVERFVLFYIPETTKPKPRCIR